MPSAYLSNINPIIPPGIVAITMYQNSLPSVLFSFFTATLNPPFISSIQSLKKNIPIANNVPKCNATSNDSGICQLKNHGIKNKCAELDIGNSSVSPCTIPKTIDWYICIVFPFHNKFMFFFS